MNVKINSLSIKNDKYNIFTDITAEFTKGINIINGLNEEQINTLFSIIYKDTLTYEGEILVNNINIAQMQKYDLRTKVIYISKYDSLFENLTVLQNIKTLVSYYKESNFEFIVEELNLKEILHIKIKKLEYKQKQKVKLLIGLLKKAEILLIDNTENILDNQIIIFLKEYLKKNNRAIIITCDEKIEELNTVLGVGNFFFFKFENGELNRTNDLLLFEEEMPQIDKVLLTNNSSLSFKYINRLTFINKIILCIILIICFFLFIKMTINISYNYSYLKEIDSQMNIQDNVILIYPPITNPKIHESGTQEWLNTTPYYFSEDNMNTLKNNEYVLEVEPLINPTFLVTDSSPSQNEYEVFDTLDLTTIDTKKFKIDSDIQLNNQFEIGISHPTTNKEITKILNNDAPGTFVDKIIYGDLPADNTNEVMIDIYTAAYFATVLNLNSLEELINKEIIFNTHNSYPPGYEGTKDETYIGEYKVKVSGIYTQSWNAGENGYIYQAYNPQDSTTMNEQIWTQSTDFQIQETLNASSSVYEQLNISQLSEKKLQNSGNYKYPGFYVQLKDEKDIEKFSQSLKEYDQYLYIKSNYQNRINNNYFYIKNKIIEHCLYLSILITISFSLIYLLIKRYLLTIYNINDKLRFYGINALKYLTSSKIQLICITLIAYFISVCFFRLLDLKILFIYFIIFSLSIYTIYLICKKKMIREKIMNKQKKIMIAVVFILILSLILIGSYKKYSTINAIQSTENNTESTNKQNTNSEENTGDENSKVTVDEGQEILEKAYDDNEEMLQVEVEKAKANREEAQKNTNVKEIEEAYGYDITRDEITYDVDLEGNISNIQAPDPAIGAIILDDDYYIEFFIDPSSDNKINNILYMIYYKGEYQIWDQDHNTICQRDSTSQECESEKISSSLNQIGLYIICNNKFPEDHYELTNEEYNVVKDGFDDYVNNPYQEHKIVTGKCPQELE